MEDKAKALAEAFRALKRGGRLALCTVAPERPDQSATLQRTLSQAQPGNGNLMRGFTTPAPQAVRQTAIFTSIEAMMETFVDHHESAEALAIWTQSYSIRQWRGRRGRRVGCAGDASG